MAELMELSRRSLTLSRLPLKQSPSLTIVTARTLMSKSEALQVLNTGEEKISWGKKTRMNNVWKRNNPCSQSRSTKVLQGQFARRILDRSWRHGQPCRPGAWTWFPIYSEFSHEQWWFSIVMLAYQSVISQFRSSCQLWNVMKIEIAWNSPVDALSKPFANVQDPNT